MSLLIRTDVTAVKIFKNYVLAGIGSTINVFDKASARLITKFQCLKSQKIYGFVVSNCGNKILVFGGKQFTVLSFTHSHYEETFKKNFEPIICDDWLHSGVWLKEDIVILLTAHNVTQKWNLSTQSLISQETGKENSILYSGLLVMLQDAIMVLAGTVFSDVIVHSNTVKEPLHYLRGHKGVIFSISCDTDKGLIVTTSDDRSVRIWSTNIITANAHMLQYWKDHEITCKYELYGHSARVMRNCITNNTVISVGEDSAICFWNLNGELIKKNNSHQYSGIWSIDADKNHLVTGGGDCAVILHPLTTNNGIVHNILNFGTQRKVMFTAKRNLIMLDDKNLLHHNTNEKSSKVYELSHESTYKMLSISSCKQIIAVADMKGKLDVFVENCKNGHLTKIIDTKLHLGKILSMQWAGNRHVIICSENGAITVLAANGENTEVYANFILPPCKERWLTATALNNKNDVFALGDRCGSIHIYVKGKCNPIKSFKKVHGRYGPTSIKFNSNELVSTGRDGTIKYFKIDIHNEIIFMRSRVLEFQWVEEFLNTDETLICGFQERLFVIYDLTDNSKVLEVTCGGGHRSWDAVRFIEKVNNDYEQFVNFIYLKNSEIHLLKFQLSKIVAKNLVNGSHSNNINCLKVLVSDGSKTIYVSGGEDTTVRISTTDNQLNFKDVLTFKQLSNVRTLKLQPVDDNNSLIFTAGGRAQICIKKCTIKENEIKTQDLIEYMIKGTDKERKGNQTWRNCTIDCDPETRIMDIAVLKNTEYFIFTGCSDACLRVLKYELLINKITLINTISHHETCILKTLCFRLLDRDFLVTATTRGMFSIWLASDLLKENPAPFFSIKTNKSGINSISCYNISKNEVLLATAGDDNTIYMTSIEINIQDNLPSAVVKYCWSSDQFHSSQITGLWLGNGLLLSTSIDQRVTMYSWTVDDGLHCCCLRQGVSDVADIQGMEVLECTSDHIKLCVFGKGMEVLQLQRTNT